MAQTGPHCKWIGAKALKASVAWQPSLCSGRPAGQTLAQKAAKASFPPFPEASASPSFPPRYVRFKLAASDCTYSMYCARDRQFELSAVIWWFRSGMLVICLISCAHAGVLRRELKTIQMASDRRA